MLAIAQTSDRFLWFSGISQGVYRFDGVQFLRRLASSNIGSMHIANVFADQAGGLWAIGDHEIAHIKDGNVVAHLDLEGVGGVPGSAEIPMGRSGSRGPQTGLPTRRFAISLTTP